MHDGLAYIFILMVTTNFCVQGCSPAPVAKRAPVSCQDGQEPEGGVQMAVRPAVLAGQWYPGEAGALESSIDKYLEDAPEFPAADDVVALVVPHAGHMWSGPVAAAGYKNLPRGRYRRIFILCPNHRMPVFGAVSSSADAFETPLGRVRLSRGVIESWQSRGLLRIDDGAHKNEHAIEIQLPFVQTVFKGVDLEIVPVIVGDMDGEGVRALGAALRAEMDSGALVVVSTDFLHYGEAYGYVPFRAPVQEQIARYDARTVSALMSFDARAFEEFAQAWPHAACGLNALRVLESALDGHARAEQLAYDTSGRLSGDDEMSVSYVALRVMTDAGRTGRNLEESGAIGAEAQAMAHGIVRAALEAAVRAQRETEMPQTFEFGDLGDVFKRSYGVFVTLHEADGSLRGCIGNILPVEPLAQTLWGRAQDAALNDPRFDPVTMDELERLKVEISLLTPPRRIESVDEIIIGKHGVILEKGFRKAVFLPQVAPEQGWDTETMLLHLSLKAGLSPNAWRDGCRFEVFTAQVF